MAIMQFLADTAGGAATDPVTYVLGLGFPGVIIGLFITGQLRTKGEVERLEAANEKLLATLDTAIPAIVKSTLIMEQITPLLQAEMLRRQMQGGGSV